MTIIKAAHSLSHSSLGVIHVLSLNIRNLNFLGSKGLHFRNRSDVHEVSGAKLLTVVLLQSRDRRAVQLESGARLLNLARGFRLLIFVPKQHRIFRRVHVANGSRLLTLVL